MNIDKQVYQTIGSFLRDICKSFPEAKGSIYRHYEEILLDFEDKKISDCSLIQDFLSVINENKDLISQRNHLFFLQDTPLLKDLSLKKVWESNISDKTRGTLWKYLETFTMINISLQSNNELQKALSSFSREEPVTIKDKQTARDIQQLKQLSESVSGSSNKETTNKETTSETSTNSGPGLDSILGGLMNTDIGAIAKEVSESNEIQNMFGNLDENANPMEMMQSLMQGNAMSNIFNNINKVIETKVDKGELSEDSLKSEAEGIYGNMGQNPLFKTMME